MAEGFERNGIREIIQFLSISKVSCGETESHLNRVFDRGYCSENELGNLKSQTIIIRKMIEG